MNKRGKFITLIILIVSIILLIDTWADPFPVGYYTVINAGVVVRFASICVMSGFFFYLMASRNRNRKKQFIPGMVIGFISGLIGFFIWFYHIYDKGFSFHLISCALFIIVYFVWERTRIYR